MAKLEDGSVGVPKVGVLRYNRREGWRVSDEQLGDRVSRLEGYVCRLMGEAQAAGRLLAPPVEENHGCACTDCHNCGGGECKAQATRDELWARRAEAKRLHEQGSRQERVRLMLAFKELLYGKGSHYCSHEAEDVASACRDVFGDLWGTEAAQ